MTKKYSWQQDKWPNFSYNKDRFIKFEQKFLHSSGISIGTQRVLSDKDMEKIKISFLSMEAMNTSEIEGEILNRESLQSSIKQYFNLKKPLSNNYPRENGIAKMMVDLYLNSNKSLSHKTLFSWHKMLMNGRVDLDAVGKYRFHKEPMQIISNINHAAAACS